MPEFLPIEWLPEAKVRFLDQTRLPLEERWVTTADYRCIAGAIRALEVRGAPLIGVAAGYALALAALEEGDRDTGALRSRLRAAADELRATRPTAVNLAWALDRALAVAEGAADVDAARRALIEEARRIHE